jgi:hypothetical protein
VHVIRVHELCIAKSALVPSLSVCVGTHMLNGGIGEGKKVVTIGYGAMARLGSPPCILVSYTSGSLNRWMKATSGTDGGSPGSSTVRCVALGSGWKYGENSPKSHKRQD